MSDSTGRLDGIRGPRISPYQQVAATRIMQGLLIGAVGLGVLERNIDIVVNAVGGLGLTVVPALLERNVDVSIDYRLSLWLTAAVFLHVIGAVGGPGIPGNLYRDLWWWDHLTHAASASLVAGLGYGFLRALDEHSDAVDLPASHLFVFTLVFVLAFGVYWELFEYAVGHIRVSGERALTQYGVGDTLGDLALDVAGGLVVALLATDYRPRTIDDPA